MIKHTSTHHAISSYHGISYLITHIWSCQTLQMHSKQAQRITIILTPKFQSKIYHHKTQNTAIMHDIFIRIQTSNRRSH